MPKNYQLFAQLCESFVTEASTSMQMFSSPSAQNVLKVLHREYALGHDVSHEPLGKKPTWTDLKTSPGKWLLIKGDKGFAGATFNRFNAHKIDGTYLVVAGTDDPNPQDGSILHTERSLRTVNDAINFVKSIVGNIESYSFTGSGYSYNLRKSRQSMAAADAVRGSNKKITVDFLVEKFKPLFEKILVASIADVRGVIASLVKNDAPVSIIQNKTGRLQTLKQNLYSLQNGTIPDEFKIAVFNSAIMTAKYFYPDQIKTIGHEYSYGNRVPKFVTPNVYTEEVLKQLFTDIQNGDKQKLSAILAFLKRSLL